MLRISEIMTRPIKDICHNCHREVIAWTDGLGNFKYKCPNCHATTVSRVISRRKVQIEITAPKGQAIRYGSGSVE